MARVIDMIVIQGDVNRRIGDGALLWEKTFETGGAVGSQAILTLMVKGLTYAEQPVNVKINNQVVGQIFPQRWPTAQLRDAAAEHWTTQTINIGGGVLKNSGSNELQIEAVGFPEATGTNAFDNFYLRDVVCFFQQDA